MEGAQSSTFACIGTEGEHEWLLLTEWRYRRNDEKGEQNELKKEGGSLWEKCSS